ncbi:MAG TPA: hypothetical protein VJH23_05805 [archaeon]|nr:hypothetical protein [archaeon]
MSTFFTFISEVLSFNVGWLLNFGLSNLFWVFALSALVHILFSGKKFIQGMIFMTFALWLWGDFGSLSGIGFFGAQILLIYYISKIAFLTMAENSQRLRPHLVVISTITGIVSLLAANIFL